MKRLLVLLPAALCLLLSGCWELEPSATDEAEDFWSVESYEPVAVKPAEKAEEFTLPYLNSQTLDPVACSDGVQQTVGSLLYEGLFELDGSFTANPVLCASYGVSANGLTYTFTLNSAAAFSDGAALTVSDVLSTYRRAQVSDRYAARFENIASMRSSRDAFVLTLKRPDSGLPALLDIPIVKSGTEKDTVPLGTGPYLFLTDTEGPCLVRNGNWWRDGTGLPERIALSPAKDSDTAVYLFSAQKAHLLKADLLSDDSAASLGGVDIADAPTSDLIFLGFNTKRPALTAPLRCAMNEALDRGSIVETLLAGHAAAARFPIHPASPLYPSSLETAYEIGAYETVLAPEPAEGESAPPPAAPVELTLLVNEESAVKTALAEYLARQLTAAYVTVTPVQLPWADYLAALERGAFDLWLGEVRLTPDWSLDLLVGTSGALNYGKYSDPATDAALQAFLTKENPETAAALCARLAEESPILPLVFRAVSVLSPEGVIEGVSPTATHPLNALESWRIHLPR